MKKSRHPVRGVVPDHWEEAGLLLRDGNTEGHACHPSDPLECVSEISCHISVVNGQVRFPQPEKDMGARGSDLSEMKVCVTLPGESLRTAEVLAGTEETLQWMTEEGGHEQQLWLESQQQQQGRETFPLPFLM